MKDKKEDKQEWIQLLKDARNAGLTKDEVRQFIRKSIHHEKQAMKEG